MAEQAIERQEAQVEGDDSREGMTYFGGREIQRTEDRAARSWDDVVFTDKVMRLWIAGESISAIMEAVDSTYHLVLKAVAQKREELRDIQNEEILNLSAERIEAFRDIKSRALAAAAIKPSQTPQLLTVALRAEENIGKLQGVLTDKVLHIGRIEHVAKKLYDFEDAFPDQGKSKVIQGEITVIEDTSNGNS